MARPLPVDVRFNAPQFKILRAVGPRRCIFGGLGRGIGKSFALRRLWYLKVAEYDGRTRWNNGEAIRGLRVLVIMPTLKQFKDVHMADLLTELAPDGKFGFLRGKVDKQSGAVTFPGGSWIKPFPATAYNARTARGMRCDILSSDEIDDIDADVYDSVAVPWLSAPWSLGIELPFGTPTRGRHGLWFRFLEAGRLGERIRTGALPETEALELDVARVTYDVLKGINLEGADNSEEGLRARTLDILRNNYAIHATYRDASETVSPVAVARARATTPEATFKREWEADPDAGEGVVYPFDENFHVRTPDPRTQFREIHVGVDHGWADPGVFLKIGIIGSGNDATAWILDEIYQTERAPSWWQEQARQLRGATFWCDPSQPGMIDDLRKQAVIDARKADNNILDGVARVADLLFKRRVEELDERGNVKSFREYAKLYVHPKCTNTIREFGLYRRKRDASGSFHEQPEDKHNHAMDALRYFAVMRFGRLSHGKAVVSGA
jgi:hypothetical protein